MVGKARERRRTNIRELMVQGFLVVFPSGGRAGPRSGNFYSETTTGEIEINRTSFGPADCGCGAVRRGGQTSTILQVEQLSWRAKPAERGLWDFVPPSSGFVLKWDGSECLRQTGFARANHVMIGASVRSYLRMLLLRPGNITPPPGRELSSSAAVTSNRLSSRRVAWPCAWRQSLQTRHLNLHGCWRS